MPQNQNPRTDPFDAVKGWRQDYWLLRLLDQRGLDPYDPGGPFDLTAGLTSQMERKRSFRSFAERLASLGWVIVYRWSPDGQQGAIAVPVAEWSEDTDSEMSGLGGLVGEALGIPSPVAKHLYRHAYEATAHTSESVAPRYRSLAGLPPEALAVLEEAVGSSAPTADELSSAVAAAWAAVKAPAM